MNTRCNNCLDDFNIEAEDITVACIGGLEIQYFACPSCGAKYVIYAADEEMQKLTAESVAIQKRIRLAKVGHVRQKTFRQIEADLAKIRARQEELEPKLKERAEKLLKGAPDKRPG